MKCKNKMCDWKKSRELHIFKILLHETYVSEKHFPVWKYRGLSPRRTKIFSFYLIASINKSKSLNTMPCSYNTQICHRTRYNFTCIKEKAFARFFPRDDLFEVRPSDVCDPFPRVSLLPALVRKQAITIFAKYDKVIRAHHFYRI